MDVWLVRLDPAADWEPFATLSRCFEQRERARYAFVLDSAVAALPVGTTLWIWRAVRPRRLDCRNS